MITFKQEDYLRKVLNFKKKVSCSNCKHGTFLGDSSWPYCEFTKNASLEKAQNFYYSINKKYWLLRTSPVVFKREANPDGYCLQYKRKWWKFW